MEKIINLLMKRDGISYQDAEDAYFGCKEAITEAVENGWYDEVDEILSGELGLEPDYIWDFID